MENVTRRDALKVGGAGIVALLTLAAGKFLKLNPSIIDRLKDPISSPTVLDFFEKSGNRLVKRFLPLGFDTEKAWRKMGVTDNTSIKGLQQAIPKTKDQIRLLMATLFLKRYEEHGTNVVSVVEKAAGFLDSETKPPTVNCISVEQAIKLGGIEYDSNNQTTR